VFTQTTTDKEGRAVRDEASTTYTGAIETAAEFGLRIYTEAWRRGWSRAKKKVVIGDGAIWIWNLADQHFPSAVKIVDLYHAREHLWELSAKLFPADERQRKRWTTRLLRKLDQGEIAALVKILRQHPAPDEERAHLLANEAAYFERNADRMRYPDFRQQGLFVGSGVIEAGCRTVIGVRLKRSGMFWTVAGANAMPSAAAASAKGSRTTARTAQPHERPQICRAPGSPGSAPCYHFLLWRTGFWCGPGWRWCLTWTA